MRPSIQQLLKRFHLEDFAREAYWKTRLIPRKLTAADKRLKRSYFEQHDVPRLHIGCYDRVLRGWLNADKYPVSNEVLYLDATRPFPFDDGCFEYAFSEHMIEHIDYSGGRNMLSEIFRVLRPGGRIRVSTPDFGSLLSLYGDKSPQQEAYMRWSTEKYTEDVQGYEDTFFINNFVRDWGHVFIYDEKVLRSTFEQIGFDEFEVKNVNASDDSHFSGIENECRMPEGFLEMESIVVEAIRP